MADVLRDEEFPSWFVVLPDGPSAAAVVATLRRSATQEITHPSGRPWLLGAWPADAVTVGEAGPVKVALIGQHAATAEQLTVTAGRTATVGDLDRLARSMVGSAHLVASVAGRARVQGTVTGLRRVFSTAAGGATVAASRADVLAGLSDAGIDEQRLALHLLDSTALYPLAGQPVWRGVDVLPSDSYLVIDGDGTPSKVRWWTAPEPVVPMAEGAPALRDALSAAVAARLGAQGLVSCDLGGLDSTALCCLAARGADKVVAYTADGRDPLGEDADWARRTANALGTVELHVLDADSVPLVYAGLGSGDLLDEPCAAAVCLDRWLVIARLAAARGSRMHLAGFGGDELLAGSPAHLHALFRTDPRLAVRNARGFAVQRRWSYRDTLRQLLDRRDYGAWLGRVADSLTAPPPPMHTPTMDWGRPPRLPPWATTDAVDAVRTLVRAAARDAEPLAERRGQHVELEAMRATSRMVRQLEQVAARLGLALAAPYYDDRVVEAGLSVRPHDRVTPWRYKPLIAEAMRGLAPADSFSRHTKDEGSHEVEAGLREHRAQLLSMCEDSRLARLGLVDAGVLREVYSRPVGGSLPFDAGFQTAACESWLRALEDVPVPSEEEITHDIATA